MHIKKICLDKTLMWNGISSLLFGFQSVILLVILTRTVGIDESGIFTIAYANASLFLLIGKYGVRNYQVSDVNDEHTFGDYHVARVLSLVVMLISFGISLIYTAGANHYSLHKCMVMILLCIYKVPDAVEDVYYGEFQRQGNLLIAAKIMSFRLLFSIFSLAVGVIISHNLALSLGISIVVSFLAMYGMIFAVKKDFRLDKYSGSKSLRGVLVGCFPLFAGTFFSQYLSNAPKYAIDVYLTNEAQACYGFIAMPVFVISLLNSIIFGPVIHKMSQYWSKEMMEEFWRRFIRQVEIISLLAGCIIVGAWLIGISVLSILYSTDLTDYKKEFMILLVGGFFLAISGLFNIMLTIMRKQYYLLMGYLIVSIVARVLCDRAVLAYGVSGVAVVYTGLMIMLTVILGGIFEVSYRKKKLTLGAENKTYV